MEEENWNNRVRDGEVRDVTGFLAQYVKTEEEEGY
jgi:hypothetical protein